MWSWQLLFRQISFSENLNSNSFRNLHLVMISKFGYLFWEQIWRYLDFQASKWGWNLLSISKSHPFHDSSKKTNRDRESFMSFFCWAGLRSSTRYNKESMSSAEFYSFEGLQVIQLQLPKNSKPNTENSYSMVSLRIATKLTWATKHPRILSIESWLFNRDPYNGLLPIPT